MVDFLITSFVIFVGTPFLDFSGTFSGETSFSTTLGFDFEFFIGTCKSVDVPYLKVTFLGIEPEEVVSIDALY